MWAQYFSHRVDEVAKIADPARLLAFKDTAWRGIFWVSLPPGILFVIGSLMVGESPRWLLRRNKKEAAYAALLRSRTPAQADFEFKEMEEAIAAEAGKTSTGAKAHESLLRRKYVIPFILACVILASNQATGINSIIAYNTNILLQSGLSDVAAHWGYVVFTLVNFCDARWGGVGGPQRPQVLTGGGHRRHYRFADLYRHNLPRDGKATRGREERRPRAGHARPETYLALQPGISRDSASGECGELAAPASRHLWW